MAQNDNVIFKTSTTATINDLFNWNKSTGQITAKTDSIPIVPGTVYFTADGHIVHDLTQNNRLWMSKNAYSAIYAKDISETNTDIANTIKYSIHYVEGPTTDTTAGTWTGTINGITELYDGLTIIYVPAVKGGSSTTTLNINGLGAKTCYYNNTSIITTHYSAGTPILLTYRNNCWRRADYNSNTTYSAMSVAEMRTGTATSERSIRADYLKTFLSTLGGTNLTLTHSNSAPYLQLNHDPSGITAGTYGNNSQQTPSYGGTFNIPYFTVDTQGHITNASITTVKIPESDNTDYKVRQTPINSNDNNNYRILLSNSANDISEDSVSKKNANLIYNPTENKLSTGNIKLTGELDVTGNVYLRNQTFIESLSVGNVIINGNTAFSQIPTAPTAIVGDSSNQLATTEFVTGAVTGLAGPMRFIGSLGEEGTISEVPASSEGNKGHTYKVITAGTYSGMSLKEGDVIISNGTSWVIIPSGDEPSGTVTSITLKAGNGISLDVNNTAITTSGIRTINHADTSSVSNLIANGRTYITGLTFDTFGHVTGYTTGTETVVNTNTATAADNILDGSNSGTQIAYAPYTSQQSKLSFDTSTTAPTRTDRLNLNGYLYATKLYSGGIEVKTKQTAVNDVSTTNATTTEFISSITQDTNGVISVVKKKLPTYNNYIHPTGNGNNHIPADGAEGQYLKYSSAGTAQWVNLPAAAGIISNTSITPEGTNTKSKVIIKATTTDVYSMTSVGSVTNGSSAILTMSVDEETETLTYSWTTNTPTTVVLPGRSAAIKTWTGYTTGVDNTYAEAQTFTGTAANHTHTFTGTAVN